jgi:predicted enzyme related to lactoylglutathione lyase
VGEGVSVCFQCEDALAIYRAATEHGIKVRRNPFVGNGMWVVPFSDPDGYRFDFESPTDVPEETEYSPQDE